MTEHPTCSLAGVCALHLGTAGEVQPGGDVAARADVLVENDRPRLDQVVVA